MDLDKKLVHVRQRADQWGTIGRPKSAAGERAIPLADVVVEALRSWRQVRPAVGAGVVFAGPRGKPRGHPMLFRAEQRDAGLVDEAGAPKYGFHILRAISLLHGRSPGTFRPSGCRRCSATTRS